MIEHEKFKKEVPKMADESIVVHQWKWAKTLLKKYMDIYNWETFCNQMSWDNCVDD